MLSLRDGQLGRGGASRVEHHRRADLDRGRRRGSARAHRAIAKGWRTKVWWVLLTVLAAVYVAGFYFPIGAIIGIGTARHYRRAPLPSPSA
jgi:hypothetical protein